MSIFSSKETCATCGTTAPKGATFCPGCGAPLGKGTISCGGCERSIPADAKFCPYCGQQISASAAPSIDANRWRKGQDDFAVRVEVDDLDGFFRRHLVIEPGTRAVMLIDGANRGVLPPGKYAMDDIKQKLRYAINLGTTKVFSAILIDDGPCELRFDVPDLFTNDPLRLSFTCQVVFQLDPIDQAPFRFMNAMLKNRRTLTLSDMRNYLFPEIQDVAGAWLGERSVKTLSTDMKMKAQLSQHLEMALARTFERSGLKFDTLRALNFVHEQYDEGRRAAEKYYLEQEEATIELEGRRLLFEVFNDNELQDVFEETKKVEHYEKRATIWARMRQAVMSDKMDEVRSEEEFEIFMREQDKNRLIRDDAYERLKRDFREQAEDHTLQRRFLVRRTEMEQQKELDRMALEGETELLVLRLKKREMELQGQLDDERLQALERKQTEVELRQKELAIALQEAKSQAEITAIQREQDKLDMELGVYGLELMDARKQKKQRQEMLLEAEREEKALARRLQEQTQQHQQELERLQGLGQVSTEVLISVSGTQQAQLLADLQRTEILSGMTEEQILAMAADKSPEVAKAFQEKFRGMSPAQQAEMYERILQEKDTAADKLADALREAAKMQQETAFKGLETQRDVGVTQAQGQGASSVVVTPGVGGTVAGGRVVVCARCHAESAVGTKFCQNCGYQFFETS
ncbi:MAG: zinc ribbon domain-containing protein [Chloroflexota bacterium]